MKTFASSAIFVLLALCLGSAQQKSRNASGDMSNMDMSSHDSSHGNAGTHDMAGMGNDGSASAMHAMEGHHMDMGPHMKMTALRNPQPGDQEKAESCCRSGSQSLRKILGLQSRAGRWLSDLSSQSSAKAISLHQLFLRL